MARVTKKKKVLEHLLKGLTLSPLEAFKRYKTMRLSAIIFDLKEDGYPIANIGSKKYAIYEIQKASNLQEEYARETEGSEEL